VYISIILLLRAAGSNKEGPWLLLAFGRPCMIQKRPIFSEAVFCFRVKGGLGGEEETQHTFVFMCLAQKVASGFAVLGHRRCEYFFDLILSH
jgi:hypothetical protein